MATEADLLWIKHWFDMYAHEFCTGDERIDSALCLKVRHTRNVALEILDIANSLNIDTADCYTAEIAALLHDIGRFEQFIRYHTYSDAVSVDHAQLGVGIIDKTHVLGRLDADEAALIRSVISHHNRITLPESTDTRFMRCLKLLRDADKIDILRVTTEHYLGLSTNDAIHIGLPDTLEVSERVAATVAGGAVVRLTDATSVSDFKLLQVSWVFDLNFPRTRQIVEQRKYLDTIGATLPRTDAVLRAMSAARRYLAHTRADTRSECECRIP
jgi:putative nucleotidyltransferase with HDIG domain